jgi:hypothetical protein
MSIISLHYLRIDRLHHGLENTLEVLPSPSVFSLNRLGKQQHNTLSQRYCIVSSARSVHVAVLCVHLFIYELNQIVPT